MERDEPCQAESLLVWQPGEFRILCEGDVFFEKPFYREDYLEVMAVQVGFTLAQQETDEVVVESIRFDLLNQGQTCFATEWTSAHSLACSASDAATLPATIPKYGSATLLACIVENMAELQENCIRPMGQLPVPDDDWFSLLVSLDVRRNGKDFELQLLIEDPLPICDVPGP